MIRASQIFAIVITICLVAPLCIGFLWPSDSYEVTSYEVGNFMNVTNQIENSTENTRVKNNNTVLNNQFLIGDPTGSFPTYETDTNSDTTASTGYFALYPIYDLKNQDTWVQIPTATDVAQVATFYGTSFYLTTSGDLYGCGLNDHGQLGINNGENVTVWTYIASDVSKIVTNNYVSLYLKTDGTLYGCGYNNYGQLTRDMGNDVLEWTQIMSETVDMATSGDATVLVTTDGYILARGSNSVGQIGQNAALPYHYMSWMYVTEWEWADRVISNNGSVFVWSTNTQITGAYLAFGYNVNGQLGLGSTTNVFEPMFGGVSHHITEIVSRSSSTFILDSYNNVYACGQNNNGQLGLGNTTSQSSPQVTFSSSLYPNYGHPTGVSTSNYTTILTTTKGAFETGLSTYGSTGTTSGNVSTSWQAIYGYAATSPVTSDFTTFFIDDYSTNLLWGTGENTVGQLGNGSTSNVTSPVVVSSARAASAYTSYNSSYYIDTSGNLYVTGSNSYGQLGIGFEGVAIDSSDTTTRQLDLVDYFTNVLSNGSALQLVVVNFDTTISNGAFSGLYGTATTLDGESVNVRTVYYFHERQMAFADCITTASTKTSQFVQIDPTNIYVNGSSTAMKWYWTMYGKTFYEGAGGVTDLRPWFMDVTSGFVLPGDDQTYMWSNSLDNTAIGIVLSTEYNGSDGFTAETYITSDGIGSSTFIMNVASNGTITVQIETVSGSTTNLSEEYTIGNNAAYPYILVEMDTHEKTFTVTALQGMTSITDGLSSHKGPTSDLTSEITSFGDSFNTMYLKSTTDRTYYVNYNMTDGGSPITVIEGNSIHTSYYYPGSLASISLGQATYYGDTIEIALTVEGYMSRSTTCTVNAGQITLNRADDLTRYTFSLSNATFSFLPSTTIEGNYTLYVNGVEIFMPVSGVVTDMALTFNGVWKIPIAIAQVTETTSTEYEWTPGAFNIGETTFYVLGFLFAAIASLLVGMYVRIHGGSMLAVLFSSGVCAIIYLILMMTL